MFGRLFVLSGVLVLVLASIAGAQIVPLDDDMQVNTVTTGEQRNASIAFGAENGDYLVVWQNDAGLAPDLSESAISGQRFDRDGSPIGSEFLVNELTTGRQRTPDVAVASDGSFVVVWSVDVATSTDPDGSIRGRRFAGDGTPLGDEFQVNTHTTERADRPDVEMHPDGDFVVAWRANKLYFDDEIRGRRFQADGTPEDLDFQITGFLGGSFGYYPYTTAFSGPRLKSGAQGEFLVAWSSHYIGPKVFMQDTRARWFDAEGAAGPELIVADLDYVYSFSGVDAARRGNGEFLVTWATTEESTIQVKRYDADGSPLETLDVGSFGSSPRIATNPNGDFLVVWSSVYGEIMGRPYTADGVAQSDPVQLNAFDTDQQLLPALAVDDDGFTVTWTSEASQGTDTDGRSVQQRRFAWAGTRIFADGFESGDTSAWVEGTFP